LYRFDIYIDTDRYTSLPTVLSFRIHPPPFSLSPTSGLPPSLHPPPRGTGGARSFSIWNVQRVRTYGAWVVSQGLTIFFNWLVLGLANG
ncbi:hypothetical protein C0J52_27420, partial [Blattella germanica]